MNSFLSMIEQYGIVAVFFIIMGEYACLPLPSEVVLPFAGAIAAGGQTHFALILILSTLAGILGSLICYIIGRTGGLKLLDKMSDKSDKFKSAMQVSSEKFDKYSNFAVAIARIIPLCRTYISFIAGAAKQPILSFLFSSALGIVVWNSVLVGLGYVLGDNWNLVAEYYERYKMILIPLFIVAAIAYVAYKIISKKKKDNKNE